MKHTYKKNNILCIIFIIALYNNLYALTNTNFEIVNGITNYARLKNKIATILQSGLRVGIEFRSEEFYNCNAVAIQKNMLLTAAHCLHNSNNLADKLSNIYIAAFTPTQAEYFEYPVNQLQKIITPFKNNKISKEQDDWAIVIFKSPIPYTTILPKNNISSNIPDLVRNNVAIESVNNPKLYKLIQNDVNPLYLYWQGTQDTYSATNKINQYWSYPLNLASPPMMLNDDNTSHDLFGNVWYTLFSINDDSKNGSLQDGDSGGPLIICKTQFDNCKLIGIISSIITDTRTPITIKKYFTFVSSKEFYQYLPDNM